MFDGLSKGIKILKMLPDMVLLVFSVLTGLKPL